MNKTTKHSLKAQRILEQRNRYGFSARDEAKRQELSETAISAEPAGIDARATRKALTGDISDKAYKRITNAKKRLESIIGRSGAYPQERSDTVVRPSSKTDVGINKYFHNKSSDLLPKGD